MKIGYDFQSTQGKMTGLGYYTAELVEGMKKLGKDELVFFESQKDDFSSLERIFYDQISIVRQSKKKELDIFHKTCFSPPIFYKGKTVVTVPDLIGMIFPENFGPASRFFWRQFLPFSIKRADFVITISKATQDDVAKLLNFPEEKTKTIYIDCKEHFKEIKDKKSLQEVQKKYELPDEFLLFVGTFEPRKNLKRLIEAFSEVKKEFKNLKLVIVGKKGWRTGELFERVKELGLEKEIVFPGYVDDKDMPVIYFLAKLFVFPSLYEGFGLPVLEALRCGVPVVCADNSSLPEVGGEAVSYFGANNVGLMGEKIQEILKLSPYGIQKIKEKGFKQAEKFSWEKCVRETREIYEKLI